MSLAVYLQNSDLIELKKDFFQAWPLVQHLGLKRYIDVLRDGATTTELFCLPLLGILLNLPDKDQPYNVFDAWELLVRLDAAPGEKEEKLFVPITINRSAHN